MKREGTGTGIGDVRGQGGEAERGRGDRDDVRGGQGEARGDGAKREGTERSERGRGEARGDEGRSCPEKATGTGTVCGTADVEA